MNHISISNRNIGLKFRRSISNLFLNVNPTREIEAKMDEIEADHPTTPTPLLKHQDEASNQDNSLSDPIVANDLNLIKMVKSVSRDFKDRIFSQLKVKMKIFFTPNTKFNIILIKKYC